MKSRSYISPSRHVISVVYCVRKLKKNKFRVLESRRMYVQPCIVVHRNYFWRNLLPLPLEQNLLHPEEIKWRFFRDFWHISNKLHCFMPKRAEVLLLVYKKIVQIFHSFPYVHNFKMLHYKLLASFLLHSRHFEISKDMLPIYVL
jgi:hypothetical protein